MKKGIVIGILSLVFVLLIGLILIFMYVLYPVKHRSIIEKYSKIYNLNPQLICAVINTESGFNKNAVSQVGAKGLMQLMPDTAQEIALKLKLETYTEEMLFAPDINIRFGCYYLNYLMQMYDNNIVNVVAAYNAGFNNVNQWLKNEQFCSNGVIVDPPWQETQSYISKINFALKVYNVRY